MTLTSYRPDAAPHTHPQTGHIYLACIALHAPLHLPLKAHTHTHTENFTKWEIFLFDELVTGDNKDQQEYDLSLRDIYSHMQL